MKIEDAYKILSGQLNPEDVDATQAEMIQLILDGCLLDDGESIVCLRCGFQNECCECDDFSN